MTASQHLVALSEGWPTNGRGASPSIRRFADKHSKSRDMQTIACQEALFATASTSIWIVGNLVATRWSTPYFGKLKSGGTAFYLQEV